MQTARAAPTPIPAFAPAERPVVGDGVFVGVEFDGGGVFVGVDVGGGVVAPEEEVVVAVEV